MFRYVLREFCVPYFYCTAGFVSIYVLFELFASFGRMSDAHPSWPDVVSFFLAYLAPYFEWIAPACLMLATLYTTWNFCRHSELTAMRASGIGFFTIVKPLFCVAVLTAAAVFWVNEVYVPAKSSWARQFRSVKFRTEEMSRIENIIFRNTLASRTWNVGMMVTEDAKIFENVVVSENYPDGGRKMTIRSPRVEFLDGQWWFLHPVVTYFNAHGMEIPSPVPVLEKLTLRAFPHFEERPLDFLLQNRDWAYCSISDRLRYLRTNPSISAETRRSYTYDVYAQMVAPLACIVITLFAIPAGIATGRQSVFRGILTALGMFFAFYACTIGFMVLAKTGLFPALPAAVLPDVIFLTAGIVMFRRQR